MAAAVREGVREGVGKEAAETAAGMEEVATAELVKEEAMEAAAMALVSLPLARARA